MPLLIAKARFRYANKQLKAGDEFEASEKDAKILKLARRAGDAGAEDPGETLGRRRRGTYNRRDMRAEG